MNLSFSEYQAIVESSPNMIWRSGIDAKCNYFNETWLKFTGRRLDQEIGDGWLVGVHPDDMDFCIKTYLESFHKHELFEMEYRLARYDKEWRWINDRGVPFFDARGDLVGYIGGCMDVTEKVEGKKLTEMAHMDKLTGLNNRNYLEYLLDAEFHKARQEETTFILMMMDIDKFKFYNDYYGHNFGDKVLNQVALKISAGIREADIAGRYGGDEFVAILSGTTIDETQAIARKILNSLHHLNIENVSAKISLSIGIVKKTDEKTVIEVLEKADKAMYHAKKDGGNRFCLFSD
jgi:diguanylate cyclase (GGDEF)-like protein/PAS domain S-box-containing protein